MLCILSYYYYTLYRKYCSSCFVSIKRLDHNCRNFEKRNDHSCHM